MGWSFLQNGDDNYVMSDGEKVFIAANVELIGGAETATPTLYSEHAGAYAVINGSLAGTYTIKLGEDTSAEGAHVDVGMRGDIFGTGTGLLMRGLSSELRNRGSIHAENEAVFIHAASGAGHAYVRNSGEIVGGYVGIGGSSAQAIYLSNSGVIEGGTYSVGFGEGADRVVNSGTMIGNLFFDAGDDTYDGRKGTIDGTVEGTMGDDTLLGGAGEETFDGGQDEDMLTGNGGRDVLTGGSQADRFVFLSVSDSAASLDDADHITDFKMTDGDILALGGIDASLARRGDQAFRFLGTKAFTDTAGELRYEVSGTDVHVMGDIDGDGEADFLIVLDDVTAIGKKGFEL